MAKRTPLPKLADALRKLAKDRGLLIADVAERAGLPAETLRNYLFRNALPVNRQEQILAAFGFDKDPAKFDYRKGRPYRGVRETDGATTGLTASFAEIDRTRERLTQLLKRFSKDVVQCFRSMGPGDLFAYTSNEFVPAEFREKHRKLTYEVARAIGRGALYAIAVPKDFDAASSPPRPPERLKSIVEFRTGWDWFRDTVAFILMRDLHLDRPQADEHIRRHVAVAFVDQCHLWGSGMTWGYFQTRQANGPIESRFSVKLPHDIGGIIMLDDMPDFAFRFRQFLIASLGSTEPDHPKSPSPFLAALRERADASAAKRK